MSCEHEGVWIGVYMRVCVHRGTSGRTCTFGILLVLRFKLLRPHSTGQVVPTPTMETESDDDPQGSTAGPSCTPCTMCGDVFDLFEVGTFPIGRLSPLHPLPRNAVNEQPT